MQLEKGLIYFLAVVGVYFLQDVHSDIKDLKVEVAELRSAITLNTDKTSTLITHTMELEEDVESHAGALVLLKEKVEKLENRS